MLWVNSTVVDTIHKVAILVVCYKCVDQTTGELKLHDSPVSYMEISFFKNLS